MYIGTSNKGHSHESKKTSPKVHSKPPRGQRHKIADGVAGPICRNFHCIRGCVCSIMWLSGSMFKNPLLMACTCMCKVHRVNLSLLLKVLMRSLCRPRRWKCSKLLDLMKGKNSYVAIMFCFSSIVTFPRLLW